MPVSTMKYACRFPIRNLRPTTQSVILQPKSLGNAVTPLLFPPNSSESDGECSGLNQKKNKKTLLMILSELAQHKMVHF